MQSLPSKQAFVNAKSVTVRSKAVRLMKNKTVPIPTKSKTVFHDTCKSVPTPAKPQSSKPKVSCTSTGHLANYNLVSPTSSSHPLSTPDSDKTCPLPTSVQQSLDWWIAMSNQSPCLRWDIPSSQWICLNSHCLITILVTIKELCIDSTSTHLFMLRVLISIRPVLFTARTISASSACTT
jgi:hypothetical protein